MNREKFASGAGGDQSAIAASCPVPIAIVNGRNEPFVNLDFLSKVKFGSLWEGRCHVIQNSGHAPFWDAPERFNQIFARFLQEMERDLVPQLISLVGATVARISCLFRAPGHRSGPAHWFWGGHAADGRGTTAAATPRGDVHKGAG